MKKILLVGTMIALMFLFVACQPQEISADEGMVEEEITTEPNSVPSTSDSVTEDTTEQTTPTENNYETSDTEEETTMAPVAGQVRILGSEGFDRDTMTISEGEAITFVNENPAENDKFKDAVIVIENAETGQDVASEKILYGESYEHVFKEANEYTVWAVGYGLKMKVVVE